MQIFPYNGKIPVHVGEIFVTGYGSPFNWWTTPGEIIRSKTLQDAYAGVGESLAFQIPSIAEAGACGGSLCAAQGLLQFGPDGKGGFAFGPWQAEVSRTDRVTEAGKPVSPGSTPTRGWNDKVNSVSVEIKWPSRSGLGMRPTSMSAGGWVTGFLLMNWFDPSRPAYTFNLAMLDVREAFRAVDGLEPGPLTAPLKPEVVVMFAPDDTPAPGVFVKVVPLAGQPWAGISIMTDPDGTAWFVLPTAGRYQASTTWNGKTYTNAFLAKTTPFPPREVAGYGHIQFVDLAGNRAEKMRTEWLPRPAKVTISIPTNVAYGPDDPQSQAGKLHAPSKSYVGGPYYPDGNGFIRNWLVCGPFPNMPKWRDARSHPTVGPQLVSGVALAKTDAEAIIPLKETDIAPAFGQRHKISFPAGQSWKPGETEVFWDFMASARTWIDLCVLTAPEMGIIAPPSNVVGYAACYVEVDEDVDLQLALGFDDAGKAMLNGTTVADFPGDGLPSSTTRWVARKDAQVAPVRLKQGRNRLLLKVDQDTDYYGFYCRFLKDNKPFTAYTVWLKAAGGADTHYVDQNNRNPVSPYTNGWASAATNIQAVINQSTTLDRAVILVAGGVYCLTSPITINKGVILKAASANRADTVLRGNNSNQCLIINHRGARVEGFTITGGRCATPADAGGGALKLGMGTVANCTIVSNSSAVGGGGVYMNKDGLLTNCSVLNNTGEGGGGGVCCNRGAVIRNCVISGNSSSGNAGGGVYFQAPSGVGSATMLDSVISNNRSGYYAGGVYADACMVSNCTIVDNVVTLNGGGGVIMAGYGIMRNCTIARNIATNAAGGGVYFRGAGTIENCTIRDNTATGFGGGVTLYEKNCIVRNCLIVNNRANGNGGGMIFAYGAAGGSNQFQNCTITSNTAIGTGGGLYLAAVAGATNYNYVENTIVYFNTAAANSNWYGAGTYFFTNSCIAPTNNHNGSGNIGADPLFVDRIAGNYRLQSASPCVNSGAYRDWMTNSADLDLKLRIRYGTVDIGAYERIYRGTFFIMR